MKSLTEVGFELWEDIATHLNKRVMETGQLQIDDKSIWDPYLHTWSNTDWILIINSLEVLQRHHPEYFDAGHKNIFFEIKEIILKHNRTHFRVMDKREIGLDFKSKAWRGIMSMREVWNNVFELDLPIEKKTRTFRRTNIWTQ
jgi:hypothetical protein